MQSHQPDPESEVPSSPEPIYYLLDNPTSTPPPLKSTGYCPFFTFFFWHPIMCGHDSALKFMITGKPVDLLHQQFLFCFKLSQWTIDFWHLQETSSLLLIEYVGKALEL